MQGDIQEDFSLTSEINCIFCFKFGGLSVALLTPSTLQ